MSDRSRSPVRNGNDKKERKIAKSLLPNTGRRASSLARANPTPGKSSTSSRNSPKDAPTTPATSS